MTIYNLYVSALVRILALVYSIKEEEEEEEEEKMNFGNGSIRS